MGAPGDIIIFQEGHGHVERRRWFDLKKKQKDHMGFDFAAAEKDAVARPLREQDGDPVTLGEVPPVPVPQSLHLESEELRLDRGCRPGGRAIETGEAALGPDP